MMYLLLQIKLSIVEYTSIDQVFPMYPEQPFFLDELVKSKIQGANALEIGLGSGVFCL